MSGSSDSDDSDQEFELQHMRNSRSLLVIISLILVAILTHLSDGAPVQVYDPTLRIDRNNLGQDNVAYLNAVLREMLGAEIRQSKILGLLRRLFAERRSARSSVAVLAVAPERRAPGHVLGFSATFP